MLIIFKNIYIQLPWVNTLQNYSFRFIFIFLSMSLISFKQMENNIYAQSGINIQVFPQIIN